MFVCRFGADSDVYVYYRMNGDIECSGCRLSEAKAFSTKDEAEMIAHLEQHEAAGHKVPAQAFDELAFPYLP